MKSIIDSVEYSLEFLEVGGTIYTFIPFDEYSYKKTLEELKDKKISKAGYVSKDRKSLELNDSQFKILDKPSKLIKEIILKNKLK